MQNQEFKNGCGGLQPSEFASAAIHVGFVSHCRLGYQARQTMGRAIRVNQRTPAALPETSFHVRIAQWIDTGQSLAGYQLNLILKCRANRGIFRRVLECFGI